MTPIDIKSTDFLGPVPNPTHFYIDLAGVVAKADVDYLIVTV
jgi:hypothetical protein